MALSRRNQWPPGMNTYTEPLASLAGQLKPKNILEVGIGEYAFSSYMWLEHCDGKLTTIDKGDWGGNSEILKEEFGSRFEYIDGRSEEVMPKIKDKFDLIYIDGDHFYEGVKADILNAQKLLAPKGVILLDDYGVDEGTADIDNGNLVGGHFGVKQAADECFGKEWERVYTDIGFANGGAAYAKKAEPRKR